MYEYEEIWIDRARMRSGPGFERLRRLLLSRGHARSLPDGPACAGCHQEPQFRPAQRCAENGGDLGSIAVLNEYAVKEIRKLLGETEKQPANVNSDSTGKEEL